MSLFVVAVGRLVAAAVPQAAVVARGSRDPLGSFQPVHALLDAQASCLSATVQLLRGPGDAVWEAGAELRDRYDTADD